MSRDYLLITPCRNEEHYVLRTIESVAAQTCLPKKWVIVDDGSTDSTPEILTEAERKYSFIEVIRRPDRGGRAVGSGVVEAFNEALGTVTLGEFDYICKLDADLGFSPGYFERLMEYMEDDPLLGNISGKTYIETQTGKWVSERMGDENAIGASKFYRVACFQEIGGFVPHAAWDGIDGHLCRLHNWIALSVDDSALRLHHYRPQGSSQISIWTGRKRWGRGKYYMGTALYYVIAASLYRMFERPYLVGGIGILAGYLGAFLSNVSRYENREYRAFLRRYELESLVFGKRRTLDKYNKRIREHAVKTGDSRIFKG